MNRHDCLHWLLRETGVLYDANLIGAASALPEGWKWQRKKRGDGIMLWLAETGTKGYGGKEVSVADTGAETLDRFRLAVAARQAMKEGV